MTDRVVVQTQDFDVHDEYEALRRNNPATGAVVCFSGLVREFSEQSGVTGMILEHYPGMTEKALKKIIAEARQRWPLQRVTLIHRTGILKTEEQIVFAGVSSAHRDAAFDACRFLMDYLKTEAPFWKKELTETGEVWVEARQKDQDARQKWTPENRNPEIKSSDSES